MTKHILGNQQQVSGLRNRKMELLFHGKWKTREGGGWELRFDISAQLEEPIRSSSRDVKAALGAQVDLVIMETNLAVSGLQME